MAVAFHSQEWKKCDELSTEDFTSVLKMVTLHCNKLTSGLAFFLWKPEVNFSSQSKLPQKSMVVLFLQWD